MALNPEDEPISSPCFLESSSSLSRVVPTNSSIFFKESVFDLFSDNSKIFASAEAKIFELSENRSKTDSLKKIEEFVGTTLDKLEELSKKQGELIGSSSGFKAIDGVTQGLQDEDLIVIAGRPSMGKTSLAMNIAENIAKNDDGCVAVFSLEMSSQSLTSRMLASMAGISQSNVKTGNLTDRQWEKLIQQAKKLEEMNIFIDDTPNISPMEIRAKSRRLAKQYRKQGGVKLVVVDYIQLMQMPGRTENRVNELSEISRALEISESSFTLFSVLPGICIN